MKDNVTNQIVEKVKKIIKWIYVSSSLFLWIPLLFLLIPQSLAPILWPNALLAPIYIWAEPAGVLCAYLLDVMIISIFVYRITVWVNNTKKVNRAVLSLVSIVIGGGIASLGWWIYRAYELSPILVQRDIVPVMDLAEIQIHYQEAVKELDSKDPQSIKKARQLSLIIVEAFIFEYEELMRKQPNYPYEKNDFYYTDYLKAKQFIKKYKKAEQ